MKYDDLSSIREKIDDLTRAQNATNDMLAIICMVISSESQTSGAQIENWLRNFRDSEKTQSSDAFAKISANLLNGLSGSPDFEWAANFHRADPSPALPAESAAPSLHLVPKDDAK